MRHHLLNTCYVVSHLGHTCRERVFRKMMCLKKEYRTSKDHITVGNYYGQMDSHWWLLWWDLIAQCSWAPAMCQEFGWEIYTWILYKHLKILISQISEVFNKREKIGSDLHLKSVQNRICFHRRELSERLRVTCHCSANCSHRRQSQQDAPHQTAAQCHAGTGPQISDQIVATSYGSTSTRPGPFLLGRPTLWLARKAQSKAEGMHRGLLPLMWLVFERSHHCYNAITQNFLTTLKLDCQERTEISWRATS